MKDYKLGALIVFAIGCIAGSRIELFLQQTDLMPRMAIVEQVYVDEAVRKVGK